MAEFCHDYEPGGLGCIGHPKNPDGTCVQPCYGDFQELVEQTPHNCFNIAICEGHGEMFVVARLRSGEVRTAHVPGIGSATYADVARALHLAPETVEDLEEV